MTVDKSYLSDVRQANNYLIKIVAVYFDFDLHRESKVLDYLHFEGRFCVKSDPHFIQSAQLTRDFILYGKCQGQKKASKKIQVFGNDY